MKKTVTIIVCIAICLAFVAGSGKTADWKPSRFSIVNNFDGVSMSIKSVSSPCLTVAFDNKTIKQCIFGEDFVLEREIGGKWYQVPVAVDGNYGFDAVGLLLEPNGDREWSVDWHWLYGDLKTGDYRIVKSILDFRGPGDFDSYYLTAGFSIS